MHKSTIYLSAAQKTALTRTAQAEGRSEATLIRAGIDIVTARHRIGEVANQYDVAPGPGQGETPKDDSTRRPQWVSRDVFVRDVVGRQADAKLRGELQELAPDTTDDLPSNE